MSIIACICLGLGTWVVVNTVMDVVEIKQKVRKIYKILNDRNNPQ